MQVDLVYLWVDGNDPVWLAKKISFTGEFTQGSEVNAKGRFMNNDELKYSLRSAEKFAPWIRRIFIVTDGQTPAWLDTSNPRIRLVDHSEILPPEARPCFNSRVLESQIYRIDGLSEHFLYANDDMFFGARIEPTFFFATDGAPIVRLKRRVFGRLHYWIKFMSGKRPGSYRTNVYLAASMVKKRFGRFYGSIPHHNIDAYRLSDFKSFAENIFQDKVQESLTHRLRTMDDFQRSAILYAAIATNRGHIRFVNNRESLRISAHRTDYMERLRRFNPKLFCLNDSPSVSDDDRRRIRPFLEELFPEKSAFEL